MATPVTMRAASKERKSPCRVARKHHAAVTTKTAVPAAVTQTSPRLSMTVPIMNFEAAHAPGVALTSHAAVGSATPVAAVIRLTMLAGM